MESIFQYFLGIQLTQDEKESIVAFMDQYFGHAELTAQDTN